MPSPADVRFPSIDGLRAFEAAARLGTFERAAEELAITASAVSKRVGTVEDLLGAQLLVRGAKALGLTAAGKEYLEQVRAALGLLAAVPLHQRTAQRQERLRVCAPPTFARQILVPNLEAFTLAHPQVELEVMLSIPYLDAGSADADIEVRNGDPQGAGGSLLMRDVVTPLVSPALLQRVGPLPEPDDLRRAPLLRTPLDPWAPWFQAAGLALARAIARAQAGRPGPAAGGRGVRTGRGARPAEPCSQLARHRRAGAALCDQRTADQPLFPDAPCRIGSGCGLCAVALRGVRHGGGRFAGAGGGTSFAAKLKSFPPRQDGHCVASRGLPQRTIPGDKMPTPITTIEDLRVLAQKRVPRMFYDYADSGSYTEGTYRANEADFHKIKLRQRVAVNMEGRTLRTQMAGQDAAMPVALAPTGLTGMQHADGEILAARAAEKFGIPFTLSTMSICSIEDVAANTTQPFWFQLYVMRDRDFIERLIERARAARCSALMLTLDLQILGQRHKDIKNGLTAPPKPTIANLINLVTKPRWCLGMLGTQRRSFGNIVGHAKNVGDVSSLSAWTAEQFDPRLSWADVEWIKKLWGGKLILKGIMDVEDARPAADSGADALIVSNHGGRQLDGAPSSIEALPAIADAVGDRIEVWLDGGIRSGQDVLKSVALGARGTLIGRSFLYGLGAMGEAGVTRCLEIIAKELDITMAFCGRTDIRTVDKSVLLPGTYPVPA